MAPGYAGGEEEDEAAIEYARVCAERGGGAVDAGGGAIGCDSAPYAILDDRAWEGAGNVPPDPGCGFRAFVLRSPRV